MFNRTLDAIGMKIFCIILVLLLSLSGVAAERPKTVPAWKNAVDKKSAEEAVRAYTANEIRCEWAGEDPRVASLMPANLGFQFAVVGDSEVTNRVQKVLKEVAGSFSPELRQDLEMRGLLNPTLQWLVRSCRPGVTNWQEYIKPQNHPAVFKESDFNAYDLKYFASRLKTGQIPLPVTVTLSYVDQVGFLGKANPGIDYPDVLPEETFTLPFGSAIVARAPERRRKIRLRATAWPYGKKPSGYVWKATGGVRILPWTSDGYQTPELGFADVIYYLSSCHPRLDIMVWAKFGREVCGPPTVISIYNIPYDQRKYAKKGLESITYVKTSPYVPYDVSAIWVPHEWKDVFELNGSGRIMSFERTLPGGIRDGKFSAIGEKIHSMSSSGYPLVTSKVEYFVSSDSGMLEYRETGEEIRYRLGESPSRRSGE